MPSFFRDGFYKGFCSTCVSYHLVWYSISPGIAWALDAYFGDTLTDMIGEYGQCRQDIIRIFKKSSRKRPIVSWSACATSSFLVPA